MFNGAAHLFSLVLCLLVLHLLWSGVEPRGSECSPGVPVVANFGSLGKELSRGLRFGLSRLSCPPTWLQGFLPSGPAPPVNRWRHAQVQVLHRGEDRAGEVVSKGPASSRIQFHTPRPLLPPPDSRAEFGSGNRQQGKGAVKRRTNI